MDSAREIEHIREALSPLILVPVAFSLIYWGLPRTALWTLPGLISPALLPLLSFSIISFLLVGALMAPHTLSAFDTRDWERDRLALLLFLTGVAFGLGSGNLSFVHMTLGALFVWFLCQVFRVFGFPLYRVCWAPMGTRWALLLGWLFCTMSFYNVDLL